MNKKRVCAILLAGGSGSRMKADITKQKMIISGESVLHRSARAFEECRLVDAVCVVARDGEFDFVRSELSDITKFIGIAPGGETRFFSAVSGFSAFCGDFDFVAVHDAARCLVTPSLIDKVVSAAFIHGAASAVSAVSSTVKRAESGMIVATEPRDALLFAETPQVFSTELYAEAIKNATEKSLCVTDDNMLVEALGIGVYAVEADTENIKITTKRDIKYAEFLLGEERALPRLRVGHGYDVHKLVEGRELILGGVKIENPTGLLGHSDADVLTHAVMDSLIGALGEGDIGRHFPDTDPQYKGISSIELLGRVKALLDARRAEVVNIDATLVLQAPKVAKYIEEMRKNVADALGLDASCVNIKATTEEHLGFTGSGEGAAAHSVALISAK